MGIKFIFFITLTVNKLAPVLTFGQVDKEKDPTEFYQAIQINNITGKE